MSNLFALKQTKSLAERCVSPTNPRWPRTSTELAKTGEIRGGVTIARWSSLVQVPHRVAIGRRVKGIITHLRDDDCKTRKTNRVAGLVGGSFALPAIGALLSVWGQKGQPRYGRACFANLVESGGARHALVSD